jgi:hypothetical protein
MTPIKYKYFSVINKGELLDTVDMVNGTAVVNKAKAEIAVEETHKFCDMELVRKMRVFGEIMKAGLMDPRQLGEQMVEMADEANSLITDVGFGYSRKEG